MLEQHHVLAAEHESQPLIWMNCMTPAKKEHITRMARCDSTVSTLVHTHARIITGFSCIMVMMHCDEDAGSRSHPGAI